MSESNGRLSGGMLIVLLIVNFLVLSALAVAIAYHGTSSPAAVCCAEKAEKPGRDHIPFDTQYDAAIHEAGHAVADVASGFRVTSMYVAVDKDKDDKYLGMVHWDTRPDDRRSPDEARRARIVVYYAGNAAEQVILHRSPTGDGDDRDNADDRILETCREGKCGECPYNYKVGEACLLNGLVSMERGSAQQETYVLISRHRETIVLLANELMGRSVKDGRRTMSGEDIEAFLAGRGVVPTSLEPAPSGDPAVPPADAGPPVDGTVLDWLPRLGR